MSQLTRLQAALAPLEVDALLLTNIGSVQWLTDFTGSFAYGVVSRDSAVFITDSRYTIQAQTEVSGMEVVSFSSPSTVHDALRPHLERMKVKTLGFESSITYAALQQWQAKWTELNWAPVDGVVANLQKIKTADEIARIRAACQLGDACMQRALSMIQPGVSEYDIGLDIEFYFRRQGAKVGFEPIVASGPNSAKPHARPTERIIQKGDFVTLDLGCTLNGYSSDLTRTVVVGEATDRHVEIYEQVLKAQVASIEKLVAGGNGRDADGLARQILDEKNLGQYFGHSLGHGLGRAVHDPGRLHVSADEPLEVGQVWTVEPGVYIEGFGGVRIEDDVLITPSGPEILTHTPKALVVVG